MSDPTTDLRDQLALSRTHLANERTLLAYVRTGLALAGGGVGLLHLVDTLPAQVAGAGLLAAGAAVLPFGAWRFLRLRRRLRG